MGKKRFSILQALVLVILVLLCPVAKAREAATLDELKKQFANTNAVANLVCVVTDNWQIAFFSHNKEKVGAAFISETEKNAEHGYDLNETASRVAELVGMSSPVIQEMENQETRTAIMIDTDIMEALADEAEHVFWGSPLEGMAYLLQDGYFYIDNIRPNGWLHWKTVKKSNVELLMPMAPTKLTAVEITGRQHMSEFAAEVLARKLGLGSNTADYPTRNAVRRQINCSEVPYMNTKRNIIGAYHDKRFAIGKRNSVAHMFANRYGGTVIYPSQHSDWPGEEKEVVEEVKESKPLTPREARDAYIERLRALAS